MKKMKKTVLVFLLILALIIQNFNIVDVKKISGSSDKTLGPDEYMYIDVQFASWLDQNPDIAIWYQPTSGSWKYKLFNKVNGKNGLYKAMLPSDINVNGKFLIARIKPGLAQDGSSNYVENGDGGTWNKTADIEFSSIPKNTNTVKITGWGSYEWAKDTWNNSSYAGQKIYFYNTDYKNNLITEINAIFKVSSTSTTSNSISMNLESDNLWSVTIPEGYDYDKVYFYDSDSELLAETNVMDGDYEPNGNNTYYYKKTILSDNSIISEFGKQITSNESISNKKLYLNRFSFRVDIGENPTIQIGNSEVIILNEDNEDDTVYSYTIPSDIGATTQTVITLTYNGNTYNFFWSDLGNNSLSLANNIVSVSGKYSAIPSGSKAVYFDATLSKLYYKDVGDRGIPSSNGTIRYYAIQSDGSSNYKEGDMEKVPDFTIGNNTYSDVYVAYIPSEYKKITFSNFDMSGATSYGENGKSTTQLEIPWEEMSSPCFYADTSDNYAFDGGTRGGYWSNIGTIRDPDIENGDNEVVDIPKETQTFSSETLYINSTFYDYYSDYELNGKNRDTYYEHCALNSNRVYQPFRQFNQALSSYYTNNSARWPLYWGNFQNYIGDFHYDTVKNELALYGTSNWDELFYANNSMWGINGDEIKQGGKNATQGLVSNTLNNGKLMLETNDGKTVEAPFFNKGFIEGNNSKNTHLGDVYESVSFPFKKKEIDKAGQSGTLGKVEYWYFDSSEDDNNLRMKCDSQRGYYLSPSAENKDKVHGITTSSATNVVNFFPFNDNGQNANAGRLNYGFGTKLEFNFRLTEDGKIANSLGERVPIEFNFSGDDDIWIFIDGTLVLDLGGDHGIVTGVIDFANKNTTVSKIKNSNGGGFSDNVKKDFSLKGNNKDEHTLTLFYMERGLWESNMYISFNFPDANYFEVEKEVDESEVNQELFAGLFDDYEFNYSIKTLATHFKGTNVNDNSSILTGFLIRQWEIPDYGTAETGELKIPVGAKYKIDKVSGANNSDNGENVRGTEGTIDETGKFTLITGENILFADQFRRGSYISLKEEANELFETSYTMYDDGSPVKMMNTGSTITLSDGVTSLVGVINSDVDDGRTEKFINGTNSSGQIINNAYTSSHKPDANTIVYRSYLTPDSENVHTRLKVVYTNKVKTGSIKITKAKAYETDVLEGDYTFTITFDDVGGENLEGDNLIQKIITLKCGESTVISGIPINTKYTISEVTNDGSSLCEVTETTGKTFEFNLSDKITSGIVTEYGEELDFTFKNTLKPLVTVVAIKKWQNNIGSSITSNLPESITVQLQRRQGNEEFVKVDGLDDVLLTDSNGWTYTFANLDKFVDYTVNPQVKWEYRVVEMKDGIPIEDNGILGDYKVTYNKSDSDSLLIQTIINTYIPRTHIKVVKADSTDSEIKLQGVEFKLEKLNDDDSLDTTFTEVIQLTDESGITEFTNLKEGKYRLTETNTLEDYILLKEPIILKINRSGAPSTINGEECIVDVNDTITINVVNSKKFVFPATGGYGNTIYFMVGFILIWMAAFIYKIRKCSELSSE